jgi:hypothetical protein
MDPDPDPDQAGQNCSKKGEKEEISCFKISMFGWRLLLDPELNKNIFLCHKKP